MNFNDIPSDKNLTTYATEEDKWNEYVDKTINFNTNYSIFTENKGTVDGNLETISLNDKELSKILRNIRIKNAEIIAVQNTINKIQSDIDNALQIQKDTIQNASDDILLDNYNIDLIIQNKIINNITDLNNYRITTQQTINNTKQFSNYTNKTTTELTTLITNTQTTITNYTTDRNNIQNVIIPLINTNNSKNINNYTQLTKITLVPNANELRSKYNTYNTNINNLISRYGSLKDQNNQLTTKNNEINSKQRPVKPHQALGQRIADQLLKVFQREPPGRGQCGHGWMEAFCWARLSAGFGAVGSCGFFQKMRRVSFAPNG
jgi:hypothetical protein